MNKLIVLVLALSLAFFAVLLCSANEPPVVPPTPTQPTTRAVVLDSTLPQVRLDSVPLDNAIDRLRDVSHANIVVEWPRLREIGVDRSALVRVRLWDITLGKALAIVLDDVDERLGFQEQDGVITVSTRERLAGKTVVRIYDIRPLVETLAARVPSSETISRTELVDAVTKMLEDTVDTESWKDNGGSVGSLREILGLLVVEQVPSNQARVQDLLEELQTGRGPHFAKLRPAATQPAR